MKQVSIIKNSVVTNSAQFDSQESAEQWVSNHEAQENFGVTELWEDQSVLVSEAILGEEGDIVTPAVYETQSIRIREAEYTVEITDAMPSQDQINAEARAYLASTDWYVTRFVELGTVIPSDVTSARATARASIV